METNSQYLKALIIQHMPIKRENAIKVKEVADRIGINPRIVRQLVQELRLEGYPICSTTYDGYWLTKNLSDIQDTIIKLQRQYKTLGDTIDALTNTYCKIEEESYED